MKRPKRARKRPRSRSLRGKGTALSAYDTWAVFGLKFGDFEEGGPTRPFILPVRFDLELPDSKVKEGAATCPDGWGLVCTAPIAKGEVVIQVPESAAFSARKPLAEGRPSAAQLLSDAGLPERIPFGYHPIKLERDREDYHGPCARMTRYDALQNLLVDSRTAEDLESRDDCLQPPSSEGPGTKSGGYTNGLRAGLELALATRRTLGEDGTELEAPVAAKQQRLRIQVVLGSWELGMLGGWHADDSEHRIAENVEVKDLETTSLASYVATCAVVLSRVQPWFGGAMVPFVDQANHGKPHLEFRCHKGTVRGRAVRRIVSGEILQSYGELSTADSLYRYGFADLAKTSAEITLSAKEVVTISVELVQESAKQHGCAGKLPRAPLLEMLGVLDPSPWDGVEDLLGVELSLSRRPAASGGVKGLRALLVAASCHAMADEDWSTLPTGPAAEGSLAERMVAGSRKLPPPGVAWVSRAALAICIGALELRQKAYRTSSLAHEELQYDAEIEQKADFDPVHLGLRQLRIIEQRILKTALDFLKTILDSHA
ncbi:hypothetical protein AK812_SmicGene13396 [Symbiodinium microadriaticum]|uniref:Uncharacterized protein n=1 Tax=Symbiodinium microadriaticum TaxID=2951 RepID=A0A1Q9E8A0_SYMMI|nr:hypothetical protein AK812_SmicGene13396 [Symbiodinium microadriaticum]